MSNYTKRYRNMAYRYQIHNDEVESKQRSSMLVGILRCFDVQMMQKRRSPLGERAGQLSNCPSELIQII